VNRILAGATAALLSGLPSTVHAVLTGRDPLAATRAAGTLLPGRKHRPNAVAGVVAHVAVSAFWTVVLAAVNRRRRLGTTGGAVAGLVIAALDLELVGRGLPAIRNLPRAPQWADHIAFGALVGWLLTRDAATG
jgi:hypothetical protein